MSLKETIKEWLKETTSKVIISIITTGILAVLGLMYANKNTYAAIVLGFLFAYWREILLVLLMVALIWIYMRLRKLEKKSVDSSKIDPGSSREELKKLITPLQTSFNNQKSAISSFETKIKSIEDDVLDLKRDYLYQKARKHEQLNQRGALLCRLEVVKLDIKDGNNYHLEESLEKLYSYVKKDKSFGTQDLSDAKNTLNSIKNDGHQIIVEEILSQIKSKLV